MSSKSIKMSRVDSRHIEVIRSKIVSMDFICSGTLAERRTTCGKPGCRCARDPAARHGPYYQLGRMEEGKLVQRTINPEDVENISRAISNHREILALLKDWEHETISILLAADNRKAK